MKLSKEHRLKVPEKKEVRSMFGFMKENGTNFMRSSIIHDFLNAVDNGCFIIPD
jgi:hypothetical protein